MTKERLNKYLENAKEISDIELQLNEKYHVADSVKTCTPPSYTAHNKRIEGVVPCGSTVTLLARLSCLKSEQRACEEYIKSIEDYQTRKMFELKFYQGKTYLQIAMILSEGKMSEDCVRKRISRYLRQN